jgi:hypothetical protein
MAKLTWEELEAQAREEERKLYMTENRIKQKFISKHIKDFAKLIKADEEKTRLYAFEFPVRTNNDGTKYADVLLEIDDGETSMDNKMFVLEFKSKKVDYQSAVAQVMRYSDIIQKALYRKKRVTPFVVAPDFSEHELQLAKENKVVPVQYDHDSGIMRLIK